MNYRLLAIDLDGTTLDTAGKLSKENRSAIREASRRGVAVVPATGRTFEEIPAEIREEPGVGYIIYSNGAGLWSRGEGVFSQSPIPAGTMAGALALLAEYETMPEVYTKGRPVTRQKNRTHDAYAYYRVDPAYWDVLDETRAGVEDWEAFLRRGPEAEMLHAFFRYPGERKECMERLRRWGTLEITTSMDNNVELLAHGVSKGGALGKLAAYLEIPLMETAALGDSRNDLTMLSAAGLGLAVGNACNALKAAADAVVCTNNENAVAYVLGRWFQKAAM